MTREIEHHYIIALGSNERHCRLGCPREIIAAAHSALNMAPLAVLGHAKTMLSRPVGPSSYIYANSAVVVTTRLAPDALLAHLKDIESQFGRRLRGQRWRARTLDLDIVLWSGGMWATSDLIIPHRHFRTRRFVLHPVAAVASSWRDPLTHLHIAHLKARLDRANRCA